jgi:hypothetical protein
MFLIDLTIPVKEKQLVSIYELQDWNELTYCYADVNIKAWTVPA